MNPLEGQHDPEQSDRDNEARDWGQDCGEVDQPERQGGSLIVSVFHVQGFGNPRPVVVHLEEPLCAESK